MKPTINPPLWLTLSIATMCVAVLGKFLGVPAPKTAVYVGIGFLVATLIPIHFKKFTRYRRDFGIVSGILITIHSIIAFIDYMNFSVSSLFTKGGLPGLVAEVVLFALLVTSNFIIQRKMGPRWKALHALIWTALPLALLHAIVMTAGYSNRFPLLAALLLGMLGIFGLAKSLLPQSNRKEALRDVVLLCLGVVLAAATYFFLM